LDREADFELTGEAASCLEAVQLACFRFPDVAVVDLQLKAPSGLETAKAIRAVCAKVRIVFVSLLAAREYTEEVTKVGASGFVVYEQAQTDLVRLIRSAL
jgi:two-component system response regulator DesR